MQTYRPGQKSKPGGRVSATIASVLLALLLSPLLCQAQEGKVLILSNEQLFSLLAALNDAGYDAGIGFDTGNKTRDGARAALAGKKIPILPEIQKFYDAHQIAENSGADLGQYISLALLLGPPPDFKLTVAESDLPPDARAVAGLIPLLKVFYKQADLVDLWARALVNYRAEVERYSSPVRRSIELTDAYLRFPAGAYLGRTYTIYLDLLGAPDQVQARVYGSNYYLVITSSKKLKIPEIRHQYLHFLLDPLAVKYAAEIHRAAGLEALARKAPALGADYKQDFSLLLTECLIKSLELRMDKVPKPEAEKQVQDMTASGLILVPYFYDALADFEKQGVSMSVYYRQLLQGIDPDEELERLAQVKFTQPLPEAAAPARSEQQQLLDRGDNDIYAGKYEEAKTVFEGVLQKDPKSARALFGLAVVASNNRKPDLARKYFKQTLSTAHDLRLVTWSHIYLGRLEDIDGNRKEALAQYHAASLTAAAYPEAMRAVQTGLQFPFGTEPGGHQ